jgi:outer membrane protein
MMGFFKRKAFLMNRSYLTSALLATVMSCLTITLTSPSARAQSLTELYTKALARDPAVVGAQAQLEAARQRKVQARAGFGPVAAVVGGANKTWYYEAPEYDQRNFHSEQVNLQITQPLLHGELSPALDVAVAQVQQAQAALQQARGDSAQRLVEACFDVLKARDALDLARAQRVSTAEQLTLSERSFKVGTVTVIDVREAQAKADSVAAQVSAAEFDLDLKIQVVNELAGEGADGLLASGLNDESLPPLDASSTEQWLKSASGSSLQLRQARQALQAAEAEVRKAWQGHAPTADLTLSYGYGRDTGTTTEVMPRRGRSAVAGVNFNIPLFASGATQAKVNEARALRDKAQSDVDAAQREVDLGVRQDLSATLSAMVQAQGLETAVRSQEAAFRANRRGYEVGLRVTAEALDAQSKLYEAKRDLSSARYAAWVNYLKLKVLTGRFRDGDIKKLESSLGPVAKVELPLPGRPK